MCQNHFSPTNSNNIATTSDKQAGGKKTHLGSLLGPHATRHQHYHGKCPWGAAQGHGQVLAPHDGPAAHVADNGEVGAVGGEIRVAIPKELVAAGAVKDEVEGRAGGGRRRGGEALCEVGCEGGVGGVVDDLFLLIWLNTPHLFDGERIPPAVLSTQSLTSSAPSRLTISAFAAEQTP